MKIRSLAVFGIGYVLGTKAGRDRYAQILALAQRASERLDGYSTANRDKTDESGGSSQT